MDIFKSSHGNQAQDWGKSLIPFPRPIKWWALNTAMASTNTNLWPDIWSVCKGLRAPLLGMVPVIATHLTGLPVFLPVAHMDMDLIYWLPDLDLGFGLFTFLAEFCSFTFKSDLSSSWNSSFPHWSVCLVIYINSFSAHFWSCLNSDAASLTCIHFVTHLYVWTCIDNFTMCCDMRINVN